MWLLGSTSQVMMMGERLSPSARCVQSPGDNPATVHSIEAILGFKEDTIFHKSASYGLTEKVLAKDAERNVTVTPTKKSHSSQSFDSKLFLFLYISPNFRIKSANLSAKNILQTCHVVSEVLSLQVCKVFKPLGHIK